MVLHSTSAKFPVCMKGDLFLNIPDFERKQHEFQCGMTKILSVMHLTFVHTVPAVITRILKESFSSQKNYIINRRCYSAVYMAVGISGRTASSFAWLCPCLTIVQCTPYNTSEHLVNIMVVLLGFFVFCQSY